MYRRHGKQVAKLDSVVWPGEIHVQETWEASGQVRQCGVAW